MKNSFIFVKIRENMCHFRLIRRDFPRGAKRNKNYFHTRGAIALLPHGAAFVACCGKRRAAGIFAAAAAAGAAKRQTTAVELRGRKIELFGEPKYNWKKLRRNSCGVHACAGGCGASGADDAFRKRENVLCSTKAGVQNASRRAPNELIILKQFSNGKPTISVYHQAVVKRAAVPRGVQHGQKGV